MIREVEGRFDGYNSRCVWVECIFGKSIEKHCPKKLP